jgi:hypothetical protein
VLVIYYKLDTIQKHTFRYFNNVILLKVHTLSVTDGLQFKNNADNLYLDKILLDFFRFYEYILKKNMQSIKKL